MYFAFGLLPLSASYWVNQYGAIDHSQFSVILGGPAAPLAGFVGQTPYFQRRF